MTRPMPVLRVLAAAVLVCAAAPALARPLAVGEVIPLEPPPGYAFRAVYTKPVLHSRWEPTDTSFGRTFREPLYTAPPGYIYRYVRGYTRVRVADRVLVQKVSVRKVSVRKTPIRKSTVKVKRTGPCVTELGYGRYHYCP